MAIKGVNQPNILEINEKLRLRKFDGSFDFAYNWYQNEETLKLVDGINAVAYDMEKLQRMYKYLDNHGELYFIEILENDVFIPIGDVTFWQEDMPIVIGDLRYRKCGIGTLVVKALVKRARFIGFDTIYVNEIYKYNYGSQALFENAGFQIYESTDKGSRYKLDLEFLELGGVLFLTPSDS